MINPEIIEDEDYMTCPKCHLGKMRLEPNFKFEGVYDAWTCEICEYMEQGDINKEE